MGIPLKPGDEIAFYDISVITELLRGIDAQLSKLAKEIDNCPDPDSFGLCDLAEGICGMGFVACQWYLSTIYGWLKADKSDALKLGPRHLSGLTCVQLLNDAANYWKHREEWSLKQNREKAARTISNISKLGIDCENDYVLSCVLVSISPSKKMQFAPLIPSLKSWTKQVSEHFSQ